jgi:hypothetical protein
VRQSKKVCGSGHETGIRYSYLPALVVGVSPASYSSLFVFWHRNIPPSALPLYTPSCCFFVATRISLEGFRSCSPGCERT